MFSFYNQIHTMVCLYVWFHKFLPPEAIQCKGMIFIFRMQAVLYAGKHSRGKMHLFIPWHSGPPVALAFFVSSPYDPSLQIFLLSSVQILEYFLVRFLPLPTWSPLPHLQVGLLAESFSGWDAQRQVSQKQVVVLL